VAKAKKGMGFKAAQKKIAKKSGVPMDNAGAILAASTRKAKKNPKAVQANPNLLKVKG
jgi:hypothetical protein